MPKNKLSDLRDHLFETLEALKDADKPMDIDRAKAITGVAQAIINSATVQVKAMNALAHEEAGGEFFDEKPAAPALPQNAAAARRVVDPLKTVKPEPPNGHARG